MSLIVQLQLISYFDDGLTDVEQLSLSEVVLMSELALDLKQLSQLEI